MADVVLKTLPQALSLRQQVACIASTVERGTALLLAQEPIRVRVSLGPKYAPSD